MNKEEIIKIANGFLIDEFEIDKLSITPTANLRETLDLDSLDYVDLVVVIEDNFGIKLTESDFKHIVTFDDFYATIENKINAKH